MELKESHSNIINLNVCRIQPANKIQICKSEFSRSFSIVLISFVRPFSRHRGKIPRSFFLKRQDVVGRMEAG